MVPALVIAEATYFGGTDASVIALAERLDAEIVVTLDRGHFAAVTPRHRSAFALLP